MRPQLHLVALALGLGCALAPAQAPSNPRKEKAADPVATSPDAKPRADKPKPKREPRPAETPPAPLIEKPSLKPAPVYALGEQLDGSIRLVDADGRLVQLSDARGKPLVLIFWSSECGLCVGNARRLPKLLELAQPFGATFAAVLPNLNEIDRDAREPFGRVRSDARRLGVSIPLWIDVRDGLTEKLGATVTPEVFVLDEHGTLRYHGAFDDEPRGDTFEADRSPILLALAAIRDGVAAPAAPGPVRGTAVKRWSIVPVVASPTDERPGAAKSDEPKPERKASAAEKPREKETPKVADPMRTPRSALPPPIPRYPPLPKVEKAEKHPRWRRR